MVAQDSRRHAMQMMSSFFLGLMVVAVVGLGVGTFYPSPSQSGSKLQELEEQQKAIDTARRVAGTLSPSHEAIYKRVSDEIAAEKKAAQAGRSSWTRNMIIILLAFGTLIMGASLVLASRFRVISNGLLLGGSFTMWYGAAWSFIGGESNTRFAAIAVALVVALVVGYVKFMRPRKVDETAPAPLTPSPPAPPAA